MQYVYKLNYFIFICFSFDIYSQDYYDSLNISFLKEKEIVGIGECIHGVSTFLEFEKILFFKLKEQYGFNNILFEFPYESTLLINSYFADTIPADSLIKGLKYFFYKSTEFFAFLNDVKEYNLAQIGEKDKVNIFGIDIQHKNYLITQLINNPEINRDSSLIKILISIKAIPELSDRYIHHKTQIDSLYLLYLTKFNNIYLINNSISEATILSLQCLKLWFEYAKMEAKPDSVFSTYEIRDSCMAEMVMLIFNTTGRKSILICHNFHIGYGCRNFNECSLGVNNLGYYLRNHIGNKYYSLGTEVYDANFIALSTNSNNKYFLTNYQIKNDGRKMLGNKLNKFNKNIYLIDYKTNPQKWTNKNWFMTSIGAVYENGNPDYRTAYLVPIDLNDGIVFFNKVNAYNIIKPKD